MRALYSTAAAALVLALLAATAAATRMAPARELLQVGGTCSSQIPAVSAQANARQRASATFSPFSTALRSSLTEPGRVPVHAQCETGRCVTQLVDGVSSAVCQRCKPGFVLADKGLQCGETRGHELLLLV